VLIDRVLIVGHGSIGKRHLRLARELLPGADIRVLRHRECVSVPEYANGCFLNLSEAITFEPHIAVIANPATHHIGVAQPLAAAGAHLLIEKPLSVSVNGLSELVTTCGGRNTILLTGYNLRFLPSLQKFRDLINEKLIGKVLSVRCEIGQYLPSWRPETDYRTSVSARKELGGGALLELSHELDYLRWLFGEVDWVKATLSRQSTLEIDVEDTAHLTLGFAKAADGTQLIGTLNMDFIRHDHVRTCCVIGETGSLRWNGLSGVIEQFDQGAAGWRVIYRHQHGRDDSYLAEWQHFLGCVQGKKIPIITGEDGLRVLKIIEAARNAADSGGQAKVTTIQARAKVSG